MPPDLTDYVESLGSVVNSLATEARSPHLVRLELLSDVGHGLLIGAHPFEVSDYLTENLTPAAVVDAMAEMAMREMSVDQLRSDGLGWVWAGPGFACAVDVQGRRYESTDGADAALLDALQHLVTATTP